MPFPWQAWVLRQWQTRNWVSAVLWPLSGLTWLVVSWRRLQRRRHPTLSPGVPVVVVGNVMVGGAGKTPLVMALAMHWQSQGIQVGVVARGFGRIATQITAVNEHSTFEDVDALIEKMGSDAVLTLGPLGFDVFIPGWRTAWLRDPNGHIVEVSQGYKDDLVAS